MQTTATPAEPAGAGTHGPVARAVAWVRRVADWWQGTRAGRSNARFGAAGGGVLTGGIAYATLFSVFAGLTLLYTAFAAVLGGNERLRQQVLAAVDGSLPGLIDTGDGTGLLDPSALLLSTGLSPTGIVAVIALLASVTSAMGALRTGVQAMFGAPVGGGLVRSRLRELAGFVAIAVAVVISTALTTAVTAGARWALGAIGWPAGARTVAQGLAALVSFLVDAGVFVLVVRVLAGRSPARRDVAQGAVIAGVGLGVVRLLGTSVVAGGVTRNPLLASFAALATLLVWVNLVARIVLLAAAWTADPPRTPTPSA